MAASKFLATKEENENRSPIKAALFTGLSYIVTVLLLVTPYLILDSDNPLFG